jgi:Leucine-rich repeat (LRR) protein
MVCRYAGTNCSEKWKGPITTTQTPVSCVSQFPVSQYPDCSHIPCSASPSECCANLNGRDSLRQAKQALGNPAWLTSWDHFNAPCGSPGWEWIQCDWQGRVSTLNFTGMGLSGTLPTALLMMSGLEVLDLSHNSISGLLPAVGFNPYLRVVDLSYNLLAGGLPDSWSQLTSLKSLDLSNNPIGVSRTRMHILQLRPLHGQP